MENVLQRLRLLIDRRRMSKAAAAVLAAAIVASPPAALACTSFVIRATDNSVVYGRTMEFAFALESKAMFIPRGVELTATGPGGEKGLAWKGKYAATGVNAFGLHSLLDGLNEKGLAGGILYFPGFAGYTDPAHAKPDKSLAPWDVLTWALTSFATVAEVKAALKDISVVTVMQGKLGQVPPVHYTLHDASGASLVIEPINGELKVYDNPLGVLTNSPPFDWHMTNLRNYVKLSAVNAPAQTIEGETIRPLGQGSGLLGVPGDPTPPSRFLRALGYSISVARQPPGAPSVRLAEHIANSFDIPKGWIRANLAGKNEPLEYTQWTSVADLANLRYYIKTYESQVLYTVHLNAFNMDAKSIESAPLPGQGAPPSLNFSPIS